MVLVILYAVTRVPNPLTGGRSAPTNEIGITITVFQIAINIGQRKKIEVKRKTTAKIKNTTNKLPCIHGKEKADSRINQGRKYASTQC